MVVVTDKMFTSEQMKLLTINNETLSIDGKYYVCKYCKNIIKKNKIPPCNEIIKKFMIDNLPEEFLTEKMSLSKLESHLLKLIIPLECILIQFRDLRLETRIQYPTGSYIWVWEIED